MGSVSHDHPGGESPRGSLARTPRPNLRTKADDFSQYKQERISKAIENGSPTSLPNQTQVTALVMISEGSNFQI